MSKKVILKYIRQKFGYLSMGCSEKSEETGQMEEKCLKNPCTAAEEYLKVKTLSDTYFHKDLTQDLRDTPGPSAAMVSREGWLSRSLSFLRKGNRKKS